MLNFAVGPVMMEEEILEIDPSKYHISELMTFLRSC